ncbi:methyltransferase family protein [Microbacterium sp. NPDC090225]|uniref:isoprenylcysteine carboxylmethyltransferase family protein n=1 Tax=Microbacterium sp. NPDC090225 TaxID=3364207 RepID=UPI0038288FCE
MFAGIRIAPPAARAYFALQAVAGGCWWLGVFFLPAIRAATLDGLPVLPIAIADIPLFVGGSALAAFGVRAAVRVVVSWTVLVAVGMAVYATVTGMAGWGALLMVAAAAGSLAAGIVIIVGRAPFEWIARGPFAFRAARVSGRGRVMARTGLQTLFFWGMFLGLLPALIAVIELRWGLHLELPLAVRLTGVALFLAATVLGIWSAVTMSMLGEGTPLPSEMARHLVIAGPYRFVRNPMAVAGIAQGVAVGLVLGSWLVVVYALFGSLVWNTVVRPIEEADLAERFGDEYSDYRDRVSCWVPRRTHRTIAG